MKLLEIPNGRVNTIWNLALDKCPLFLQLAFFGEENLVHEEERLYTTISYVGHPWRQLSNLVSASRCYLHILCVCRNEMKFLTVVIYSKYKTRVPCRPSSSYRGRS